MQAVIFRLQHDEYALNVTAVSEVVRMVALTPLPDAPEWIAGVVNLRGHVIPVIDLRRRLHLSVQPPDRNTSILIVQTDAQCFGMIVDALVEVLDLPAASIETITAPTTPRFAIQQLIHLDHRVILLLNPSTLSESIPVIH
ncbi:MAG: chemotaxis protein CheW [Caldilinea sp.]